MVEKHTTIKQFKTQVSVRDRPFYIFAVEDEAKKLFKICLADDGLYYFPPESSLLSPQETDESQAE